METGSDAVFFRTAAQKLPATRVTVDVDDIVALVSGGDHEELHGGRQRSSARETATLRSAEPDQVGTHRFCDGAQFADELRMVSTMPRMTFSSS